jgi:hypothetical protein
LKDTFDAIPISVVFGLKSEPCSGKCGVEVSCAVNEKDGVSDIVFLLQFSVKNLSQSGCHGRKRRRYSYLLVAVSAAVYSQYCRSLMRISVSSTAA